ncbi:tRNA (uridine(54)-C5)-methyltransferase TrmA [Helicobacter sp. 11-8110]|uniref:tRNA (uridine(54)-C5)-methyltransferase TrmA n=1 Tax=Helicobacter sp. 11-8110 TaxID=2004997 RepID=UPI000DCEB805|nr:tRNA (uridine(54)-C5)-methyltransferase TrmA [Helicobacter sp. 11-8110]RAX53399.1 tRNA (uridine(54)-C5)-methyltransferase TrmA [Helicobacter sp. 11-8110]
MFCEYLGVCGGCSILEECGLEAKVAYAKQLLGINKCDVISLKQDSFRARCELGIFHKDDSISYVMRKDRQFVCIENCCNLLETLQKFLPTLKEKLNQENFRDFRQKLFAIEVLSTQNNEILLTLIYHRKLDEFWLEKAKALKKSLQNFQVEIMGRSKGVKLIVDKDYVVETLEIFDKKYFYRYDEGVFTQPNPKINEKMIEWVLQSIPSSSGDLLEMYCGCGNFTIPLSQKFKKVLATEISKVSIRAAKFACEQNGSDNIAFVRLSGQECIEAIKGLRKFERLRQINLETYCFSMVLVDPPRAGLGEEVCQFLQDFPSILYISCNPLSLAKDLEILNQTHRVVKVAFFDQFPHTLHLETGILLQKNDIDSQIY